MQMGRTSSIVLGSERDTPRRGGLVLGHGTGGGSAPPPFIPAIKIAITTIIKRSELSALNNRINDYNVLARANYLAAGADGLIDFEANIPQLNIATGDTTNTTYYTDGTHVTTVSHGLMGAVARPVIQSLLV